MNDEIIKSINNVLSLQDDYLKSIEKDINLIISNKIIDDSRVEKLLDNLLNLLQTDKVLYLFKKICKYYYYINPVLIIEYCYIYNNLYLDDNEKYLKKMSKL